MGLRRRLLCQSRLVDWGEPPCRFPTRIWLMEAGRSLGRQFEGHVRRPPVVLPWLGWRQRAMMVRRFTKGEVHCFTKGEVMLQPVDFAVAYLMAHLAHRGGGAAPADVQRTLEIPWASLSKSLGRLDRGDVVVAGRPKRKALAVLLPALQYLLPIPDGDRVSGLPTGAGAPSLRGRIHTRVPPVWPFDGPEAVVGRRVEPLFRTIPHLALRDARIYELYAALDLARTGRARELQVARESLSNLIGMRSLEAV